MARLDRHYCDICSNVLPSFGYMRLKDGCICMDCNKLVSPFLKGVKDFTIEDMKRHLDYRRENEKKLSKFKSAINFGYDKKIYIDPYMAAFVITSNRLGEIEKGNPDVVSLHDVIETDTKIKEYTKEEFDRDDEGRRIRYFPPRIQHYYDFITTIRLRNEWFDEISISLNGKSIEGQGSVMYKKCNSMAKQLKDTLMVENNIFNRKADNRNNHIYRL